jgi:hypothetical protein
MKGEKDDFEDVFSNFLAKLEDNFNTWIRICILNPDTGPAIRRIRITSRSRWATLVAPPILCASRYSTVQLI